MRIALVSTYPPRRCALASYAADLGQTLSYDLDLLICAIDRHGLQYPAEVVTVVNHDNPVEYHRAARVLAEREVEAVLIQHEYGIFGGTAGSHVLILAEELRRLGIPYLVTLHTVLAEPHPVQQRVLASLTEHAAAVTTFTETSRRQAISSGVADADRLAVVPHGVPTIVRAAGELRSEVVAPTLGYALRPAIADLVADLDGRRLLATLGAISPDKGLETAITALPDIVAAYPDVRYLIAGSTHPEVARREGESYRMSLQRLATDLGLGEVVRFLDAHLTTGEVAALLGRTEVYLTPYRSREQASSSALTYAVAAGCPVVSTDYHYAVELLGGGAGITVPCNDPDAFGAAVVRLLGDPGLLTAARTAADRMAAELTWPAVAQRHEALLRTAIAEPATGGRRMAVPNLRLDQLTKLTDEIGILHSARGYEPDTESGYRCDDIARTAIVGTELLSIPAAELPARTAPTAVDWITGALRFLQAATAPHGMRRRMAYSGVWEDEPYLGDHIGRSIWALGVVAAGPGVPAPLRGRAESLRDDLARQVAELVGLRATGYAILGLAKGGLSPATAAALTTAAARLDRAWQGGDATWRWFEHTLGNDSARLAQAMIAAGHSLGETAMVERGIRSLEWYLRQVGLDDEHGMLRAPTDRRRYPDESARPGTGDEHPVDAAAAVEALIEAYTVTGSGRYGRLARRAFEWFLGVNRFEIQMYDPTSGGCHDSVGPTWVDPNQGAEATLAYYQALLALANSDLVTLPGGTAKPTNPAGGVEALSRHLADPH